MRRNASAKHEFGALPAVKSQTYAATVPPGLPTRSISCNAPFRSEVQNKGTGYDVEVAGWERQHLCVRDLKLDALIAQLMLSCFDLLHGRIGGDDPRRRTRVEHEFGEGSRAATYFVPTGVFGGATKIRNRAPTARLQRPMNRS
jgi:hypothetical protein